MIVSKVVQKKLNAINEKCPEMFNEVGARLIEKERKMKRQRQRQETG